MVVGRRRNNFALKYPPNADDAVSQPPSHHHPQRNRLRLLRSEADGSLLCCVQVKATLLGLGLLVDITIFEA